MLINNRECLFGTRYASWLTDSVAHDSSYVPVSKVEEQIVFASEEIG